MNNVYASNLFSGRKGVQLYHNKRDSVAVLLTDFQKSISIIKGLLVLLAITNNLEAEETTQFLLVFIVHIYFHIFVSWSISRNVLVIFTDIPLTNIEKVYTT